MSKVLRTFSASGRAEGPTSGAEIPGNAPAVDPAGATGPPSFVRALRNPAFLWLWLSQFVSQSGDYVFDVALIWLVLQTTGSIFAVGLVSTAALAPTVLLGPVLGVYVDRWPRRTILVVTNVAEGVLVAALSGLILAHAADLAVILAVVVALSVGGRVVALTSSAMVPQTVAKDDLGPANGLTQISGSTTQIAGLSIGGIVVALFGVVLPITYDAVTFFAAAAIVTLIAVSVGRPEPPLAGVARRFSSEFAEGVRYIRSQRWILELIALGLVVNFCGNAVFTLWAPYAERVLQGGAATYGFLGAAVAVGAIVGALVVGKVDFRTRVGPTLLAGDLAAGAVIVLLGMTRSIPLALTEAAGFGVLLSVMNVPLFAALQARVPARLLGRATAVLMGFLLAAAPFGAFFAGTMAERSSIPLVYEALGLVVMAVAPIGAFGMRELRRLAY